MRFLLYRSPRAHRCRSCPTFCPAQSLGSRLPGTSTSFQGSASTSQARLTVDGPLAAGARYLLSMRRDFRADRAARRGVVCAGREYRRSRRSRVRWSRRSFPAARLPERQRAEYLQQPAMCAQPATRSSGKAIPPALIGSAQLAGTSCTSSGSKRRRQREANWSTGVTTALQSERRDAGAPRNDRAAPAKWRSSTGSPRAAHGYLYSVRSDSVSVNHGVQILACRWGLLFYAMRAPRGATRWRRARDCYGSHGVVADRGSVARGDAVARLFGPPTGRAREREVLRRPVAAVDSRELSALGLRAGD